MAIRDAITGLKAHERAAFVVGLAIRALLLVGVPVTYTMWFLPFLGFVAQAGTPDPWTGFLFAGGSIKAFPYGPIYLLAFLPGSFLGGLISDRMAALGVGLTVLLFDIALFRVIRRLAWAKQRGLVVYAYWLSPIVIYVNYWHGQLDVLPVLMLSVALLLLRHNRFARSGAVLGLATAAKMSMGIAIPFVWIYVTAARRLRSHAPRLIAATLIGFATMLPFILSPGFRWMVIQTQERKKIFSLVVPFGGLEIYLMPLAFAALVFAAWRIRRFNFDVLFSLAGVGFFAFVLLTPASPGWSLWLMPFLAVHICRTGSMGRVAALAFSLLFVAFHLLTSTGPAFHGPVAIDGASSRTLNLMLSLYLAGGGMVAIQILQDGLLRHPFYRTTRTPLALAIAGDSGSGKDTLVDALHGMFGRGTTALISGDDYHSWDRVNPMWRSLTHLNPKANDLRRFNSDILSLKAGHAVEVPHYDHRSGRMTKPHRIDTGDMVISWGLHALYSPDTNAAQDLRIFLSMDEELRVFLKLRRDVRERGHSIDAVRLALTQREADSARYIRPQADAADLLLSLLPLNRRQIDDPLAQDGAVPMALRIEASISTELETLARVLIAICGMEVRVPDVASDRSCIEVVGDPSIDDIAAAARQLAPRMTDYIAMEPEWRSGLLGVMQLVVLDQLGQKIALRKAG